MTIIWKTQPTLEIISERSKNTLMEYFNIDFFEIGDNFLCARMEICEKTRQPMGIMHGGASCALAESVGSMAAAFCVDVSSEYCVGLSLNTNHIKAVKSGLVIAKAKPLHLGRSTQVWSILSHNEDNKLVAASQLTMVVCQL